MIARRGQRTVEEAGVSDLVKPYPTEEAWAYFLKHLDDIRAVVEQFGSSPAMQSMAGPLVMSPKFGLSEFDAAVERRDSSRLFSIMNDAWLRAPEDREVYSIPGFSPMCNLLDITIEGFIDDGADAQC